MALEDALKYPQGPRGSLLKGVTGDWFYVVVTLLTNPSDNNTSPSSVQLPKCPATGKKSFVSETDAVEFEERNREQYQLLRQYTYAFEDCTAWHLTGTPPGTDSIAQVNYSHAKIPVSIPGKRGNSKHIDTQEVIELKQSGLSSKDIAKRLDISQPAVYYHLQKTRTVEPKNVKIEKPITAAIPVKKVGQMQKIGIKQSEYAIATEELKCTACHKAIAPGMPYLVKRSIQTLKGEFIIAETIECLSACSLVTQLLNDVERDRDQDRYETPKIFPIDSVWEQMPEIAGPDQQNLKIVTNRGTWVATGYKRILSIGLNGNGLKLLECTPSQVQKQTFALFQEKRDPFGIYEAWKEPNGMHVREYKQDDRDMRAGMWYLPLSWLTVQQSSQTPQLLNARPEQAA